MGPIITVEASRNAKTGIVAATYAPAKTCPRSCPFAGGGCYGKYGPTALHLRRINEAAGGLGRRELAVLEAKAIRSLSGQLPLRLHVVGDCSSNTSAETVSASCRAYSEKFGQPVWTYTHAWRRVQASSWDGVAVLASCETAAEVKLAHQRGYAAAVTGEGLQVPGLTMKQCPAQTKGATCASCQLCWSTDRLHDRGIVIVFSPHGPGKHLALETINRLRKEIRHEAELSL